jgi:hypothetical protein
MASLHRKAGFADKRQGGQNTTHRVDAAAAVEVTDVGVWYPAPFLSSFKKTGLADGRFLVPRQYSKRSN